MQRAELIAIPDLHFPWAHNRAVDWCVREVRRLRPKRVVQLGDLYDQYCFSKYPKNPNVSTPRDELQRGRKLAQKFWHAITKASPDSERVQLLGNHDVRVNKRIAERLPELQGLVNLDDLYGFPDVQTLDTDRDAYEFQLRPGHKVVVLHGWMTKVGSHLNHFENRSVIFGHVHRPHLLQRLGKPGRPNLFELNCGYMADPMAPVFEYGGTVEKRWQIGYGLVDANGRPDFVGYPGK